MKKYRKKPIVIEAIQWKGNETVDELKAFLGEDLVAIHTIKLLIIRTLEGNIHASLGDWIIRGVKGEHYPCKPDIFETTYEKVL